MSDKELGTSGFSQHSGKFPYIYRALVVDNDDPLQLGRIKARIYPMLSGITDANLLPWIIPAMSLFTGAGDGIGLFCVPTIDSYVYVFFEQGDMYQPVYFAESQTGTKGLPTDRTTNYPNRRVWKTSSGIIIYIDDTDKHIKIVHPTGTYILLDTDGNITLDPNSTHRAIISAFSRSVTLKSGGTLNGDDGGLILFAGPVTFILPSASSYPGLEYVFKKLDAVTVATIGNTIEPDPNPYRLLTGIYSTLHVISGGSTNMWHVI
jgi:hypothetical protein